MVENFKYEFDHKTGILYKYYFGSITMRDIEFSWEYAFDNEIIPKDVVGFILDYRKASFHLRTNEYLKIPLFYKQHLDVFGGFKIAIITESPKDIVVPVLVKMEDDGYLSEPFSTVEAALEWILDK